jgi:hypothetical protein
MTSGSVPAGAELPAGTGLCQIERVGVGIDVTALSAPPAAAA